MTTQNTASLVFARFVLEQTRPNALKQAMAETHLNFKQKCTVSTVHHAKLENTPA